mgnify:FL=1
MKRHIPDYYAQDIFSINPSFFKKQGVRFLLCDLDNTLDSYRLYSPSERVVDFKEKLEKEGIQLFIISNNHGERVESYAKALGVPFSYSTRKPFTRRLLAFLKKQGIDKKECALIGDQLITDVSCGKKSGILTILTEPIVKEDQWTTRFNRLIDRPMRRRLKKQGKLKRWEEAI